MYGRHYDGKDLRFEASGGLMHAALVMRDKETDSYWSIMTGDSIGGDLKGTRLVELPLGEKAQWKDWVAAHPATLVLSVNGRQHVPNNPYDQYFASDSGFRGISAQDDRLDTKDPIFSFQREGQAYAVPLEGFEDGGVVRVAGRDLLLYRPKDAEIYYSTLAFEAGAGEFERQGEEWRHVPSGARLDPSSKGFVDSTGQASTLARVEGFDTFWYMWSLTHPKTEILEARR